MQPSAQLQCTSQHIESQLLPSYSSLSPSAATTLPAPGEVAPPPLPVPASSWALPGSAPAVGRQGLRAESGRGAEGGVRVPPRAPRGAWRVRNDWHTWPLGGSFAPPKGQSFGVVRSDGVKGFDGAAMVLLLEKL